MTKSKAGADTPAQEQPIAEVQTAPIEEQPQEGGSYIRNPDGSLTREEEA